MWPVGDKKPPSTDFKYSHVRCPASRAFCKCSLWPCMDMMICANVVDSSYISSSLSLFKSYIDQEAYYYGLSPILDAIIIRATWNYSDERLFYYLPSQNLIWLDGPDHDVISSFGIFKLKNDSKCEIYFPDIICPLSQDRQNEILLAEFSSRGSYSFHFGHFIIDFLPHLLSDRIIASAGYSKPPLITFPMQPWEPELACTLDIKLEDTLPMYRLPVIHNNLSHSPTFTFYSSKLRFLALGRLLKARLLKSRIGIKQIGPYSDPLPLHHYGRDVCKGLLISRNESNVPPCRRRILNEEEIVDCFNKFGLPVDTCSPTLVGPKLLNVMVTNYQFVISAAGSALYQLFHGNGTLPPCIIMFPPTSPSSFWNGQARDFLPYRSIIWSLAPINSTVLHNSNWNMPIDIAAKKLASIVEQILRYENGSHYPHFDCEYVIIQDVCIYPRLPSTN